MTDAAKKIVKLFIPRQSRCKFKVKGKQAHSFTQGESLKCLYPQLVPQAFYGYDISIEHRY